MSLEQAMVTLTESINQLIASLGAKPPVASVVGATVTGTDLPTLVADTASDTEQGKAGKKTYIFMKKSKKGFIVQKGELLPVMDSTTVSVGKTQWLELCKQYNLDPETGDTPKSTATASVDDLDDEPVTTKAAAPVDDLDDEPVTNKVVADDDFNLDDEPVTAVDPTQALKDKLIEVVKKTGQTELVRKILAKLEVQNADQLKADHVERGIKICEAAIAKYAK